MPSRNKKINRDFQIEGRRSVLEALKNPSRIEKLLISDYEKIGSQIEKILKIAKKFDINVDFVTKNQLDKVSHTKKHQGVIATTTSPGYYTEKKLWDDLEENNQRIVVVLDGIQDPHNIGAISRTALAMGVFALVLPKRNSAGISPGSLRSSAGAIEHLKIVRVSNINSSLSKFKELGFWVIGLDHNSNILAYLTTKIDADSIISDLPNLDEQLGLSTSKNEENVDENNEKSNVDKSDNNSESDSDESSDNKEKEA